MKKEELISLGYTEKETERLFEKNKSIICFKKDTIIEKEKKLISLGYTKEQIKRIAYLLPALFNLSTETIEDKISFIESLGYTRYEVIKMTVINPSLFSFSKETLKAKIEFLIDIGLGIVPIEKPKFLIQSVELTYARYMFLKNRNIKITDEKYSNLFYGEKVFKEIYGVSKTALLEMYNYGEYKNDNTVKTGKKYKKVEQEDKVKVFLSLGYTKEQILKMYQRHSLLFNYGTENINNKFYDLEKIGYIKEEIIKMTLVCPNIFSCSIDTIKQKIEDLISLGFTKEDVLKITSLLPTLLIGSITTTTEKIKFLRSIDLGFIITSDPKKLMQSVELTYARYMFFKEQGITIDKSNYSRLYYGSKLFKQCFKITKEELLEKYPYNNYNSICKQDKKVTR